MPYLHGRRHRLCPARVRAHGHLHQVWQAHERVSHLPAVRGARRACVQVLKPRLLPTAHSPPSSIPDISVYRSNWKLTVQRLKLFLEIIFTTNGTERFFLRGGDVGLCHAPASPWTCRFPGPAGLRPMSVITNR